MTMGVALGVTVRETAAMAVGDTGVRVGVGVTIRVTMGVSGGGIGGDSE